MSVAQAKQVKQAEQDHGFSSGQADVFSISRALPPATNAERHRRVPRAYRRGKGDGATLHALL